MLNAEDILKDKKFLWSMILDKRDRAPRLWSLYDKLKADGGPVAIQYGYPESSPSLSYWWPYFDEDREEYDSAINEAVANYIAQETANSTSNDNVIRGIISSKY